MSAFFSLTLWLFSKCFSNLKTVFKDCKTQVQKDGYLRKYFFFLAKKPPKLLLLVIIHILQKEVDVRFDLLRYNVMSPKKSKLLAVWINMVTFCLLFKKKKKVGKTKCRRQAVIL